MAFASKTDEVVSLYGTFEMPHFVSFISHGMCVVGPARVISSSSFSSQEQQVSGDCQGTV